MTITFFSNYLNHHQLSLCEELIDIIGDNFKFVATQSIPAERLKMGYEDMNANYSFVVEAYKDTKKAYELGIKSDIVIYGHAPKKFIKARLKNNKITLRYSERIFKNGVRIKNIIALYLKNGLLNRKNDYLLCASAYAATDYNKFNKYKNKAFKFGYFPKLPQYNLEELMSQKQNNSITWVSRFIELKHPELIIELAKDLKQRGYEFQINMIGDGPLFGSIEKSIKENKLSNNVVLFGSVKTTEVYQIMKNSKIFIFSSDQREGWGAVTNESMNSGCAVVANKDIGSIPFLIENNVNGFYYNNYNELLEKVKLLLDDDSICRQIGINAYNTINNLWNAKVAAERLVEMSNRLLEGKNPFIYEDGPCSKAIIIN